MIGSRLIGLAITILDALMDRCSYMHAHLPKTGHEWSMRNLFMYKIHPFHDIFPPVLSLLSYIATS